MKTINYSDLLQGAHVSDNIKVKNTCNENVYTDDARAPDVSVSEYCTENSLLPYADLITYSHSNLLQFIQSAEFWNRYIVTKSLSDGHCFLYSILTSLHDQGMKIEKNELMYAIKRECLCNIDQYVSHLSFVNMSKHRFLTEMDDYLIRKLYDSKVGDQIPEICSKALNINVVIVFKSNESYNVFVIHNENARFTALVLKTYKHYDGMKCKHQPATSVSLYKSPEPKMPHIAGDISLNPSVSVLPHIRSPVKKETNITRKGKSTACRHNEKTDNIKICAWNIYGLDDHKLQPNILGDFLSQNHIIMLSETWADNNTEYKFNSNFECVNVPRKFKHRCAKRSSGGLCTFIHTSIYKKGVEVFKTYNDSIIWFRISKEKFGIPKDVFLASVYFPPEGSTHIIEDIFYVLQKDIADLPGSPEVIIAGDMNSRTAELSDYHDSNYFLGNDGQLSNIMPTQDSNDSNKINVLSELQCASRVSEDKKSNNFGNQLLHLCKITNLLIVNGRSGLDKGIGKVTCSNSRGQSVVDYVLCTPDIFKHITKFQIHRMYPESDHSPIMFEIKCKKIGEKCTNSVTSKWDNSYKYVWDRTSICNLEKALKDKQSGKNYSDYISSVCQLESTDQVTMKYSNYVNQAVESVFVKRKVNVASHKPTWFDKECKAKRNDILNTNQLTVYDAELLSSKNKEYRSLKQKKRRDFSNNCKKEIENAYKKDKSSMWKVINTFSGDKIATLSPSPDDFYEHFQKQSCPTFNDTFDYKLENEAREYLMYTQNHPMKYIENSPDFDILNKNVTETEVSLAIHKLKNNKSAGPDGIVSEFLKASNSLFTKDLTHIYNYIIEKKQFPNMWAEGLRNPIFKSGSKSDCLNYRGITVLSVFEKVFESISLNRLEFVSEAFKKYDRYNTGFLKGSRTGDNNFVIMGLVQRQLNLGRPLIVIHVDFSRAFDLINRNILFYKLYKSGYRGRVIDTLMDLYRKTSYRVKVGNKISENVTEFTGVNQGGITSPFLFREYLSDLKSFLDEHTGICLEKEILIHELFADDLYLVSDNTVNSQKQLDGLRNFSRPNQMIANVVKTKFMAYGNIKNVDLFLNGKRLEQVDRYKSLGTLLNSVKMPHGNIFKYNPDYLNSRAKKAFFGIQRKLKFISKISPVHMFYLYETLIQPILLYGSDIWGAYSLCTKNIDHVYLWFIRCVLRIKATTCNVISIGESGIIPPHVKCHENVILNFIRLNSLPPGSVVKSVFSELELLHGNGILCWYTQVIELSKKYNIDPNVYTYNDKTKAEIRKKIRSQFIASWKADLQDQRKYPILRFYSIIKNDFGQGKYLSLISNNKYRNAMSRFRASSHTLEIERGRYTTPITPINERVCPKCNVVENEYHFLLNCQLYSEERRALYDKITKILPEFPNLLEPNRLVFLLCNEHDTILSWVGKFIYESFNKRTEYCTTK